MSVRPLNVAVATNNNRTNSQGIGPSQIRAKTTLEISNTVGAGKTATLPVYGTFFYLTASSGELSIRPSNGFFNRYTVGTGLKVNHDNAFDLIEVKNETAQDISFRLFVGFDEYLDKRLIIANPTQPEIIYPTYPVPEASNEVIITDRSGNQFLDANGNKWIAMTRVAILVFNVGSSTVLVQESGAVGAPDVGPPVINKAVGAVYPGTSLRLGVSGDYLIRDDAALNIIVSEIYASIANPN